ncbi:MULTISPECIES: putative leader peptide [unclassified Streptomyces]
MAVKDPMRGSFKDLQDLQGLTRRRHVDLVRVSSALCRRTA